MANGKVFVDDATQTDQVYNDTIKDYFTNTTNVTKGSGQPLENGMDSGEMAAGGTAGGSGKKEAIIKEDFFEF